MASLEPFNRLVKLAARAFYDDITTRGENQPKAGRSDNRGIAVVILDALTRRQWIREEDLAKDLKLHTKQLRRTLRFFEEEKLVTRDHRKESSKGAKIYNAAVAAAVDGQQTGREGDEKLKAHTQSYCCVDYAQIYDVVRYRLHRMKKKLKDELESKNTVQEYICPNCSKRYNALDALRLISPHDEYFHCERCDGVLVAESEKFAAQELGDGDDNASRRRHDKLKDMLTKMEEQLKPLIDQLGRVKDLPIPEFGSLQAWELRANAAGQAANGDLNANDPSKSLHGLGFGGTPMPYVGETKVEVAFSGTDEKVKNVKSNTNAPLKVLPPWMIKDGMNLTKEQRGETRVEAKMSGISTASKLSDDKKSTTVNEESKNIQDEYVKAYYAALLKRQCEQEEAVKKELESPQSSLFSSRFYSISTPFLLSTCLVSGTCFFLCSTLSDTFLNLGGKKKKRKKNKYRSHLFSRFLEDLESRMAAFAVGLVLLLAMAGHSDAAYCICNDGVSEKVLQENIDYACGDGADCSAIHQNGACYNPDTVKDHCNYAVNSYFQRKGQGPGSCDFKGTASVTQSVPNVASGCVYASSPSNAGNATPTGPTAGGTPNAAGGTTAGTLTPPGGIGLAPTGSGFGYPDGSDGVALLPQGSTFVLLVSFSIALLVSGIMGPRI